MKDNKLPPKDERGFLLHMSDLKASYRAEYRKVRQSIQDHDKAATAAHRGVESLHADTMLKKGMLKDLNLAINWMHTGRCPGSKTGVERRGAYELERAIDPMLMQAYVAESHSRSGSTLTLDQQEALRDALDRLSERERTCYVMSRAYCVPYGDIANVLAISKGAVQAYVERAEEKVSKGYQASMF